MKTLKSSLITLQWSSRTPLPCSKQSPMLYIADALPAWAAFSSKRIALENNKGKNIQQRSKAVINDNINFGITQRELRPCFCFLSNHQKGSFNYSVKETIFKIEGKEMQGKKLF